MESTFGGIYKGKRVLLTGHTGFKGSWMALWLKQLGAEVIGYSIGIPTHPSHADLLNLQIVEVIGDILDEEKIFSTIKQYQPDIVFHMAAQAIVRTSYRDPIRTFSTNVMGTGQVLEACRKAEDVKAIVNITSDKCYQNREQKARPKFCRNRFGNRFSISMIMVSDIIRC
jgi:CDP-glucose 4,6-dehydratase